MPSPFHRSLRRTLGIVATFLLLAHPAWAEAPLELGQAFTQALSSHPSLAYARFQADAARAHVGVARMPLVPTASLDVSHTQTTANFIPRPGFLPGKNAFVLHNSPDIAPFWLAAATGRWNAYDFGRTQAAVDAASRGVDAAEADVLAARSDLWLAVATAYLQALAAEAALRSLVEAEAQTQRYVQLARVKVEAQVRPKLDLLKAESDEAQRHVDVLRGEEAVRSARVALGIAIGNRHTPMGPLQAPTLDVGTLEDADLEGDPRLDTLVEQALRVRPDYLALDVRIAQAEADLRALEKAANPTLYLQASTQAGGTELSNLGWNYSVQGGVNVPLSALWTQTPQVNEARGHLRALMAQRDVVRLGLRSELDQARTLLQQARKRMPAVVALLKFTEEARTHAESRYAAGVATLIELSDADAALVQARIQKVQAEVDVAVASARLLRSLGRLPGR
jgi:outer membrane protein